MTTPRIGFACKFSEHTPKGVASVPGLNYKGTTVAWLKRQRPNEAEDRMWTIVMHNIAATKSLVNKVGELDAHLRMVRLGSDMLPMYTEPSYELFGVDIVTLVRAYYKHERPIFVLLCDVENYEYYRL